jgi:hypothetical protein
VKKGYVAYVLVALAICLVPSVGLLFGGGEVSSDSDSAPAPRLVEEDGSINLEVLSDAGSWFDDHFAFRNEFITACSSVTGGVFETSSSDEVIQGSDGWLFYGNSLGDYQGTNHLTDRQLHDIARDLRLMQDYVEENGSKFVFTIAPNKNSLYDANMPYYYQGALVGERNRDRLVPFLEEEGVNYVDLYEHFSNEDEVLYHATDSHWNNKGASQAADLILESLNKEHPDYSNAPYEVRSDFTGDLEKMLYPAAPKKEDEIYYSPSPQDSYDYETSIESTFDPFIQTKAKRKSGTLLMYRDSFGNSLLPFMAENYSSATFSRGVPYSIGIDMDLYAPDTVVVERAERFLQEMAEQAPLVPGRYIEDGSLENAFFSNLENVTEEKQGNGYTLVTGKIPEDLLTDDSDVFIRVDGAVDYEAASYSDSDGNECFSLLVPDEVLDATGNSYGIYLASK